MALVCLVLVGALVVGYLVGGSVARFARLRLRARGWVVAAAASQLVGILVGMLWPGAAAAGYPLTLAVSAGCVGLFLLRNRALPGVPLAALGLALNALVVTANGAMPVSAWAADRAGVPLGPIVAGGDPRHRLAGGGTAFAVLGDVIPVPVPVWPEVVSLGDALIAAGLGLLVVSGMRSPARAHDWRSGRMRRGGGDGQAVTQA
jgi:hypothetical protein